MTDILLVSTWGTACGIAEHAAMLKEAVEGVDASIRIRPTPEGLDPFGLNGLAAAVDLVHLNYQAALHSRWTPEAVAQVQALGIKVVITYHDTGVPNSDQCKGLHAVADAFVIHEPADDLPGAHYIRMGVSDWQPAYQFDTGGRPMLGTVGFPFPWKCYDQLARVTAEVGWDLLLLAPNASEDDQKRWKALNPRTTVCTTFLPRHSVVSWLAGCDATAFTYVTHNTGQSGAILQGIAARKPVIALRTCRQFRALYDDDLGHHTIRWCDTFEDVAEALINLPIQRVDPRIVALAEQESWHHVGRKYIEIYRSLL